MGEATVNEMNTVVVAADNSPFSEHAFKKALRVFAIEKTRFHIIHIRPVEENHALEGFSDAVKAFYEKNDEKRHQEALQILSKFKALAEAAGASHHTEVELKCEPHMYAPQGDPREEICRYCREVNADVLVLGSRGQGPAGRFLMGSVSLYCMSHAPCTVMIDHDKDAEEWTAMQTLIKKDGTRHE